MKPKASNIPLCACQNKMKKTDTTECWWKSGTTGTQKTFWGKSNKAEHNVCIVTLQFHSEAKKSTHALKFTD